MAAALVVRGLLLVVGRMGDVVEVRVSVARAPDRSDAGSKRTLANTRRARGLAHSLLSPAIGNQEVSAPLLSMSVGWAQPNVNFRRGFGVASPLVVTARRFSSAALGGDFLFLFRILVVGLTGVDD